VETIQQDVIRSRLTSLEQAHGGILTPEAVLEDARNPASPLHTLFEWDEQKAAYSHWLETARRIIRSVRVVVKTETATVQSVAYVRAPDLPGSQQGYRSVLALRSDKAQSREAIVQEFQRAGAVLRRARELAEALEMREDVEDVIDSVEDLKVRALEAKV